MIIFSRWGFMAIVFGFVTALFVTDLNRKYTLSPELLDILFLSIWGGACVVFGTLVKALGSEGSVFWIPIGWWGAASILCAGALVLADPDKRHDELVHLGTSILSNSAHAQTAEVSPATPLPTLTDKEKLDAILNKKPAQHAAVPEPNPPTELVSTSAAQAAFDYLETHLTGDPIMTYASAKFESWDGNVCHVRATENFPFPLARKRFFVDMAGIDLDSLEITGGGDKLRAVLVAPAKNKMFPVAEYDEDAKGWGPVGNTDGAAFFIADGNGNAILRAVATLAQDCGARPNGF